MKSVLLEFLSTDEETLIFIIRQDWQEKGIKDNQPLVIKADFNENDIKQCVKEIRELYDEWRDKGRGYKESYLDKIKLEERTQFYNIGEKVFTDELMKHIIDYELIYLVPFSALHHLPIHAMKYKRLEIIEQFACSYLPSASVLQFCNKNKDRPQEFNLKGIAVDSHKKKGAGYFIQEVNQLTKLDIFKQKKIYLEKEANKKNLFLDNEKFNLLHCSTHAYFHPDNPLKSGITLDVPEDLRRHLQGLSNNILNDESLKVLKDYTVNVNDFIDKLDVEFELVFISACVSGQSKNEAGDELIGLSRGLFYSGTKSMILSLFPTFKNKTGRRQSEGHVKKFYQFWIDEKQTKAQAFQNYIKELKKHTNHPFYWFGFILIGNPY